MNLQEIRERHREMHRCIRANDIQGAEQIELRSLLCIRHLAGSFEVFNGVPLRLEGRPLKDAR